MRTRTILLLALAAAGCSDPAGLVDVTAQSGIDFRHDQGFRNTYYFPETVGSGVTLLDLEGDGDLDVYAVQCGVLPDTPEADAEPGPRPVNRTWANRGDARFDDVTERTGDAAHSGYGMGASVGDVDGDGLPDLFLTNYGPDALLVNRGEARFEDLATGTPLADPAWTAASGFADLDQDGHLDLVVCGYVRFNLGLHRPCVSQGVTDYCDVSLFDRLGHRIWRGDGRGGFEERTEAWGLADVAGKGLGLALVDLDDDGDVDAYVANDSIENHVFLNAGGGRFEDVTFESGAAYNVDGQPEAGMGVGVADVDADGRPDLFVTNFAGESNALYVNAGEGRFRDRSRQSGLTALSRQPLGFGTLLCDLDRDGIDDLVVSNGHVLRHVNEHRQLWTYAQPDQLFRGLGEGRFELWDAGPALTLPRVGRGLAAGDLDGDGDADLVLNGSGEELLVLANELAAPGTSWLQVALRARGTNTQAIGARVVLELEDGRSLSRWVRSGTGFLSQDDLRPLFGFRPEGSERGRLRVRWPDGTETTHDVEGFERLLELVQPGS